MPIRRAVIAVVAAVTLTGAFGTGTIGAVRPAAAAATTEAGDRTIGYSVRAGDSFSAIASRYGITAAALARANRLRVTSTIQPGQVLVVPVTLPAGLPAHLPAALTDNVDRLLLYPLFVAAASESGAPLDLLMATAYIESGWNRSAVSAAGAIGVGQLMRDTARWIAVVLMHEPALDATRVRDNIRMSGRFLRYLLDTMGTTRRALAAYFQGPASVARDGITATGLRYAGRILAARPSFG